jgi:ABC-2 type transport system permease protein
MRRHDTTGPGSGHRVRRVHAPWATVIRSFAFLRKEVVEIIRQPRLVATLVIGPFALLLIFGYGYGDDAVQKRTLFVAPPGSVYERTLDAYAEDLGSLVSSAGMIEDEDEARAALVDGEVDVVVVFPPDPQASVLRGERAAVQVLHREIDPLQTIAVEVAARLAVQEVNAAVLTSVVGAAQDQLGASGGSTDEVVAAARAFAADPRGARDDMRANLAWLRPALDGSATVLAQLAAEGDRDLQRSWERVEAARRTAATLAARVDDADRDLSDEEVAALGVTAEQLAAELDGTVVLDPQVLIRPFESETENLIPGHVTPDEYFTPASVSLLLQHLAITFAALSLVRDRRTGLFELMRVGPLSSVEILVGKTVAYLLVGSAVAALIVAGAVLGLGVDMQGSYAWLAVVSVGVLLASLALGLLLASFARTESQAVQFAMLALLAALFFGGFILPDERLLQPARSVSYLLPVTHGIDALQDVVLRGVEPERTAVVGLAVQVVVYGALAVIALRRRLLVGDAA